MAKKSRVVINEGDNFPTIEEVETKLSTINEEDSFLDTIKKLFLNTTWESFFNEPSIKETIKNCDLRIGKNYLPTKKDIFRPFVMCPLDQIKVLILGKEPYSSKIVDNNDNLVYKSNGLAFSTKNFDNDIPVPVKNIFKLLSNTKEIKFKSSNNGDLSNWVLQGIFLLNVSLTKNPDKIKNDHAELWSFLVNELIKRLKERKIMIIYWGDNDVKKFNTNPIKGLDIEGEDPKNPFNNKFIQSDHILLINNYIKERNFTPINWTLS